MRGIRQWVAYGLIASPLVGFTDPAAAAADSPSKVVTISMRNYASIADARVTSAQREADRILGQASVRIIWRNIPVSFDATNADWTEALVRPQHALSVQLLSASMAARLRRPGNEFGFVSGFTAYVFWERLEQLARNGVVFNRSRLLGNIIAHEIGHILLSFGAHSGSGLMRPHWGLRELQHADQGTLTLTPLQIERLRRQPFAKQEHVRE